MALSFAVDSIRRGDDVAPEAAFGLVDNAAPCRAFGSGHSGLKSSVLPLQIQVRLYTRRRSLGEIKYWGNCRGSRVLRRSFATVPSGLIHCSLKTRYSAEAGSQRRIKIVKNSVEHFITRAIGTRS